MNKRKQIFKKYYNKDLTTYRTLSIYLEPIDRCGIKGVKYYLEDFFYTKGCYTRCSFRNYLWSLFPKILCIQLKPYYVFHFTWLWLNFCTSYWSAE